MIRLRSATALLALCSGCVGVPSPLAPALEGSVGVPHLGAQTSAVELPLSGPGFVRFRPYGQHHFALPRLVELVSAAAERVATEAPGGAPLVVGDLSARFGGKIQGHNSHRSGRDVDLLLYLTTPSGAPVRSPGFVAIDGDGLGRPASGGQYVRLDVEREWLLVKTLLSSDRAGVQFMFLSKKLEALLIDYAIARGEPAELIYRAETVLLQPTDSTPHDDHIHLRIACAPSEAITGCSGGGPYWDWLPRAETPGDLGPAELLQIAADDPVSDESIAGSSPMVPGGA
ncbi:MAG TPA: penicillin-insensitive murein endopeptidase [Polyangiaceae bacterium]|nr:penicillin-insensitive murein endopeptidase [Polyangiaceae bacterium]